MKRSKKSHLIIILLAIMTAMGAGRSFAAAQSAWVAKIISAKGIVEVRRGSGGWQAVQMDDILAAGDMVRVQKNSRAAIMLASQAIVRLDQNTTITIPESPEKKRSLLDIIAGAAHFFSHRPSSLEVRTPFVNASVEGTEFLVEFDGNRTFISVFRGMVSAVNRNGSLDLQDGQSAVAFKDKAPEYKTVVRPRDAVQWTLNYPMLFDVSSFASAGQNNWQSKAGISRSTLLGGSPAGALSLVADLSKEDIPDPAFFIYRAMLYLTVGRMPEAESDIKQSLKLDSSYSDALAMQSVIAVVTNDRERALQLSEKAVAIGPESSAAYLALSYSQQADFQIKEALASVVRAGELEPANGLVRARQAELELAAGDLRAALLSAGQAVQINPALARPHSVMGFVALSSFDTEQARQSFLEALAINSEDYLSRFGLGLAKIKEGDLEAGRQDLEIAVSLDPGNSLIRSYLGKAFYEEKNSELASRQLAVAKELDPKDPTPWLYEAFVLQGQNRPVEAMQSLQQSIALNDNRLVYRSRMLLDEDLSVRGANLARVYSDLGLQQLALAEGYKSLNSDPGNYSAHRFLADMYGSLPRHEIGRVSEVLQSQLLQPVESRPVSLQTKEARTYVLQDSGPSAGYNEYSSLFTRNRLGLDTSAVVGGNGIFSDEVIHYGVQDRISYSLGQYHYETEGFRPNNDQSLDVYNLFVQGSLSPFTSVQAEVQYKKTNHGDLPLRFDPDNYDPESREDEQASTVRGGLHHSLSPRSDILVSVIYRDGEEQAASGFELPVEDYYTGEVFFVDGHYDMAMDFKGFLAETQYLYNSGSFHLTGGLGYTDVQQTCTDSFHAYFMDDITTTDQDLSHFNSYIYSDLSLSRSSRITIGASLDAENEKDGPDNSQFNPKLGVSWQPVGGTTLRAAAFRTMRRTLVSSQTIEPSQVAGFNQFFNDFAGTDSWRFGVGVDHEFSRSLYGGLEISRRDLDIPWSETAYTFDGDLIETEHVASSTEDLSRAYLYWLPSSAIAVSAEAHLEELQRDIEFTDLFTRITTWRVPLSLGYFHPSGLRAKLTATYFEQKGDVIDFFTYELDQKETDFWLVDFSLGYRPTFIDALFTVTVKNMFNREVSFQDTDPVAPRIVPESLVVANLTFSL